MKNTPDLVKNYNLEGLSLEQKERMLPLVKNPLFGLKTLYRTSKGRDVKSNCFGTLFYIIGLGNSNMNSREEGGHPLAYFPEDMPGYVNEKVAQGVIEGINGTHNFEKVSSGLPGDIVCFWEEKVMNHSGIVINDNLMFNQWGYGGIFDIIAISRIISTKTSFHRRR